MTLTPTLPIIVFDRDPAIYVCRSVAEFEGLLEPAFLDEFDKAFDAQAREIRLEVVDRELAEFQVSTKPDLVQLQSMVGGIWWLSVTRLDESPDEYVRRLLAAIDAAEAD